MTHIGQTNKAISIEKQILKTKNKKICESISANIFLFKSGGGAVDKAQEKYVIFI